MKASPIELIVQEKACAALQGLAVSFGAREVSMVASGAAIVGAMQKHVGEPMFFHACGLPYLIPCAAVALWQLPSQL
jgi:hypothetical protein